MRIALIADIHGNVAALEAVVADIERRGVDQIVNLGDSLSGPLLPLETAHFLMDRDWLTLAGNHERQLLTEAPEDQGPSDAFTTARIGDAELDWIRGQPPTAQLSPEIFLCHGTPASDAEYFLETVTEAGVRAATASEVEARLGAESSSVIACAHTHMPRLVRCQRSPIQTGDSAGGQLIINPGSVGLPAYDADEPLPHVMESGSPDARYAILEKVEEGWTVSLLAIPYDHRSMALLAEKNGRPDWREALSTGYIRSA